MTGFFGWFLIIVAVLAIFNAERLPDLQRILEGKFKESLDAANKGKELAKSQIEKAKKNIEAKKNAPATKVEAEENSPEEIEEALKFMSNFTPNEKNKEEQAPTKVTPEEVLSETNTAEADKPVDPDIEKINAILEEGLTIDDKEKPIDLNNRD
jgi:Sec-independent protein translocase protein TatA